MIEKVGDGKAKANLQPTSYVRKIDSKCLKSHSLSSKKDKKDIQGKHHNEASKDREKAKSCTPSITNQPQDSKKRHRGYQGNCSATEVNTTKVVKKEKFKAKDLSHVKYYICKQKSHYANKCSDKPKNKWRSPRLPRQ